VSNGQVLPRLPGLHLAAVFAQMDLDLPGGKRQEIELAGAKVLIGRVRAVLGVGRRQSRQPNRQPQTSPAV
jgi:hypothetical protein